MFVIFNTYALVGIFGLYGGAFAADAVGLPGHTGWLIGAIADLMLRYSNRPDVEPTPKRRKGTAKRKEKKPHIWFGGQTGGQIFWLFPVWFLCGLGCVLSLVILSVDGRLQ